MADLDPVSSSYNVDKGSVDLHGRTYPQSVSLRVDKNSIPANDAEYNIGGTWKYFDATVGQRDDSPTGGRLAFQVFLDGRSVFSQELTVGQTRKVHVNAAGASRLKIKVEFTAGEYYNNYSYGAWGDARFSK
ncbi:NPCBM/NEW2 domain-containing protein [Streptomyces gilvosporeus]|uniref:NPCBM/NEW2 domain-containing protein n=1 Tax=Streptomyces gilvosporeus TaxID=553510 RepID=UPI00131E4EF3|nr:NPCBM/NEW2 domain-containing protein [Streptomyces gilvosporeus]